MAARSTSRFKRKPAVPFGDFMLPILGVIALGIVVMGIRMLWAPSTPKSSIVPQPRVTHSGSASSKSVSKNPSPEAVADSSVAAPRSSSSSDAGITAARPVNDEKTAVAKPAELSSAAAVAQNPARNKTAQPKTTVTARPAQPKPAAQTKTPQPKPAQTKPAQPKPAAPVKSVAVDKSQFIVQCGSFTDKAGADVAVSKLKSLGYSPVIRKADVRGKSYFRVVVGGGSTRNQAEAVEADIKQKTSFPTLVRSNSGN